MSVEVKSGVYCRKTNPVLFIALVICAGGVIAAYWFGDSTPMVFLLVGVALAIQVWRGKTHGIALVHVDNGDIVFLDSMERPNQHTRIRISDVIEIAVAGLPDDQRYRFTLRDGRAIKLRPYFERQYNEQIIHFLEAQSGNKVRIDIQGPLGPMEEMHGDFKSP